MFARAPCGTRVALWFAIASCLPKLCQRTSQSQNVLFAFALRAPPQSRGGTGGEKGRGGDERRREEE
eukprot:2970205-Pyramimonas_sp.AAC.1